MGSQLKKSLYLPSLRGCSEDMLNGHAIWIYGGLAPYGGTDTQNFLQLHRVLRPWCNVPKVA